MISNIKTNENIQIETNNDIFGLLKPNDNYLLAEMTNSDKVYIMMLLKRYYLELRKKLNIDDKVTFGTEIEFEESYRDLIELAIYCEFSQSGWIVKDDGSLLNGGEVVSPILRNTEQSWIDLSRICNIVSNNAKVLENTSAHIHIGMQILGNNTKYWINFAKLWSAYENIIFRFLYGEYLSHRPEIEKYAKPISKELIKKEAQLKRKEDELSYYLFKALDPDDDRRKSINFTNISATKIYDYDRVVNKNTIEFRSPNGTFNPIIWQNNINLLVHLLEYAKSSNFNEELINKRIDYIKGKEIPSNLYKYSQINIEQAIELADLIFNNNLDKIYFLRQYIKSGEVSTKPLVKSRRFTI